MLRVVMAPATPFCAEGPMDFVDPVYTRPDPERRVVGQFPFPQEVGYDSSPKPRTCSAKTKTASDTCREENDDSDWHAL